ncbi:MAG: hypothetical protein R3204_16135, partial [Oceanospirillum sp.]|nr:hypothetical protein [Oceanospirillum sp.]
ITDGNILFEGEFSYSGTSLDISSQLIEFDENSALNIVGADLSITTSGALQMADNSYIAADSALINIQAAEMNLSQITNTGLVSLSSEGIIADTSVDEAANIVAGELTISAGQVGDSGIADLDLATETFSALNTSSSAFIEFLTSSTIEQMLVSGSANIGAIADLSVGNLKAGSDLTLSVTGDLTQADNGLLQGGNLTLTTGSAALYQLEASDLSLIAGGDVLIGDLTATGNVLIDAAMGISQRTDTALTGQAVTLNGSDLTLETLTATDLTLTASNTLQHTGTLTADTLSLSAGGTTALNDSRIANTADLQVGGDLSLGALTSAGSDLTLSVTGDLTQADNGLLQGGNLTLTTGSAALYQLEASDLSLIAGGDVLIGDLTATGN